MAPIPTGAMFFAEVKDIDGRDKSGRRMAF